MFTISTYSPREVHMEMEDSGPSPNLTLSAPMQPNPPFLLDEDPQ
jgi:hypothetical protein